MFRKTFLTEIFLLPLRLFLKVNSIDDKFAADVKSIQVIWPKTSLGILLSSKPLFINLKTLYPNSVINLVVHTNILKKLDKALLRYLLDLNDSDNIVTHYQILKIFRSFDVVISPTYDKFYFAQTLAMRFSKSISRIGIRSIDDSINPYSFLFDRGVKINLSENHDAHISEYISEILKVFSNYNSPVFNLEKKSSAYISENNTIDTISHRENEKIIVINNQPEDIRNRWGIENLISLTNKLVQRGNFFFYFIEDEMEPEVKIMLEKGIKVLRFVNKNKLEELLTIFSVTDLVVTVSSDIMHLAGVLNVPQISLFGYDNAFKLAPIGNNKLFIRKSSELINDISGAEVFDMVNDLLEKDR